MSMLKLKDVIKNNPGRSKLIKAVIEKIGMESVEDVINHGADSGFPGFTYYTDTSKFYVKYRTDINAWITESHQDYGYNSAMEMVKSFRCASGESEETIGRCIYGGKLNDDTTTIENCLAWFALEEVCRLFDN